MDKRFLCRGKRLDNGEWVYGYLFMDGNEAYISGAFEHYDYYTLETNACQVIPASIGQCTGLSATKSYRGTEPEDLLVFEGDILQDNYHDGTVSVWWDDNHLRFVCRGGKASPTGVPAVVQCAEIIGNVFDMPELLKKGLGNL